MREPVVSARAANLHAINGGTGESLRRNLVIASPADITNLDSFFGPQGAISVGVEAEPGNVARVGRVIPAGAHRLDLHRASANRDRHQRWHIAPKRERTVHPARPTDPRLRASNIFNDDRTA